MHADIPYLNNACAQIIALYRHKAGLSQDQLAAMLGIEKDTIAQYESGAMPIPVGEFLLLSQQLALPLEALWQPLATLTPAPTLSEAMILLHEFASYSIKAQKMALSVARQL